MANKGLIIDVGKRYNNAFGFASNNSSQSLKRAGFADAIKNADVYLQDTRTNFEEIQLKVGAQEIAVFGYMGFVKQLEAVYAPPPMVSFRKGKRMEETVLDGPDGQVVEKYGHRSWDITIQGLLINMDTHYYPGEKIRKLIEIFNRDERYDVVSQVFSDHGIKSIYLTDMDDQGVQGYPDTWQFTLYAKSIVPVYFDLKN